MLSYSLRVFLILAVIFIAGRAQATDSEADYQFINTQQSGTLEKELNQQAAAGWRLLLLPKATESSTMGALLGKTDNGRKYEYKVLAATRIGTLEKEFADAVKEGFDYRGLITTTRILVGNESLLVLEREQGQSVARQEYIFLNTKKESTLEKEMDAAVSQGYVPAGFSRTTDNSVKQKMFGIMAGSPYELTLILARNREKPASEMGREFKILTTIKRGTLEKELNEMAKEGYRFHYAAPGSIVVMARDARHKTAQYEYKILGTNRVGAMEKEMNEVSQSGFAYRASSTGGGGLATIFEKRTGPDAPGVSYETRLITKTTDTSTNKSIQELRKSGFTLIDVTNLSSFLLVFQKATEK
jgi:hypothetical protein